MINTLQPERGKILLSEPFMLDPNFRRSVILLVEHDENGSVGFVLNQPGNFKLNDILQQPFEHFDADVYVGGPVEQDTLFFLHTVGDVMEESHEIFPGLYWGGNFETLKILIEQKEVQPDQIRFFIGYSGWDQGQLDKELKENSWLVSPGDSTTALSIDFKNLWQNTLKAMGKRYSHIANFTEHFYWN